MLHHGGELKSLRVCQCLKPVTEPNERAWNGKVIDARRERVRVALAEVLGSVACC